MSEKIHERVLLSELSVSIVTLRRWLKAYYEATGNSYINTEYVDDATAEDMRKLKAIVSARDGVKIKDGIDIVLGRYTPPLSAGQTHQIQESILDIGRRLDQLSVGDPQAMITVDRSDWDQLVQIIGQLVMRMDEINDRLDKQAVYLREVLTSRAM